MAAITIELAPDQEARLTAAAKQEGLDPAVLARKFVIEQLPGASPVEQVRAKLRQWQAQDNTPVVAGPEPLPGETPTQALFRKWDEEDARMTEEEREAEDRLWEGIEKDLDENGAELRLRRLDG